MDDLQKNSRYDMIIGQSSLLDLKLDLCLSYYKFRGNGGAYVVCAAPTKDP